MLAHLSDASMKSLFQDIFSYILLSLSKILAPKTGAALARLATQFSSDLPDLNAPWVIRFRWPAGAGRSQAARIDVTIRQFGKFIRASGHPEGEPDALFEYTGTIRRNVVYGTFRRKDSHVLAGTGAFIIKILADNRTLAGSCAWYASRPDAVWRSPHVWRRRLK